MERCNWRGERKEYREEIDKKRREGERVWFEAEDGRQKVKNGKE